jgi:hypothetical protein
MATSLYQTKAGHLVPFPIQQIISSYGRLLHHQTVTDHFVNNHLPFEQIMRFQNLFDATHHRAQIHESRTILVFHILRLLWTLTGFPALYSEPIISFSEFLGIGFCGLEIVAAHLDILR